MEKTELWVGPLALEGVDLGACAEAVARVMGLRPDEVMVTDAQEQRLTFDVLVPTMQADQFVARHEYLLQALAAVDGVSLNEETRVHSEGILGLISLDEKTGQEVLERSADMGRQISDRIKKRAMILATGPEVINGEIVDTNTPFLTQALAGQGYQVESGPALPDEAAAIVRGIRQAAENAFGLVITTGGVGAEGKDQTLEALTKLDPTAATPYVLKFRKGYHRHAKDGVRLGVGRLGQSLVICLPGPHDEVGLLWSVVARGLREGWGKEQMAQALAEALRDKFLAKNQKRQNQKTKELWEEIHGTEEGRN